MSQDANDSKLQDDGRPSHFIAQAIEQDLKDGRYPHVVTRFPPEPNGYLHIGHAKAICIDFGMANAFGGKTNLRLDDTNPTRESQDYIDAIQRDVRWLGFEWDRLTYASDTFDQLYAWAKLLIEHGYAYVDDQTPEAIRANRGDLNSPGINSPFRDRPPQESLDLFARMKAGEFPDGSRVLRAKIDMADRNMVMRDPTLYRILHAHHPRTGDDWCIYPMYDWAHGQCDWIEGVTHSLCDLSFEIHRPLYEWCIDTLAKLGAAPEGVDYKSRQIEFARGNITHLITSKRKLLSLVEDGHVTGWDDPRMPTLAGMRRRGYPPQSIVRFWDEVGVAKRENNVEIAKLENILRADLNAVAQRRMVVLDPLRVTITNYPEDQSELCEAVNNPESEADGTRQVPFGRSLWIERSDFMEDAPRKFFRLSVGREVRLRYAYWLTCQDVVKNEAGEVIELLCTYDPQTKGGESPPPDAEGNVRKVKGTIHWVSAEHAEDVEVRQYDHLFKTEDPEAGGDWQANLNEESVVVIERAKAEPAVAEDGVGKPLQLERTAYYVRDMQDNPQGLPVLNRTVTLRDSWAKQKSRN
jgi:glutaminyl-tRNA synthetase